MSRQAFTRETRVMTFPTTTEQPQASAARAVSTASARALGGAVEQALDHLIRTQAEDGSWHGDYGGPMFLLPLYVATCRIAGIELAPDTAREMLRYLRTHQNADGGFGLETELTYFGTYAQAVALAARDLLLEDEDGVTRGIAAQGGFPGASVARLAITERTFSEHDGAGVDRGRRGRCL